MLAHSRMRGASNLWRSLISSSVGCWAMDRTSALSLFTSKEPAAIRESKPLNERKFDHEYRDHVPTKHQDPTHESALHCENPHDRWSRRRCVPHFRWPFGCEVFAPRRPRQWDEPGTTI